jgi:hypothetical protein
LLGLGIFFFVFEQAFLAIFDSEFVDIFSGARAAKEVLPVPSQIVGFISCVDLQSFQSPHVNNQVVPERLKIVFEIALMCTPPSKSI